MYSEEIKTLLEIRKGLVSIKEYLWIIQSPQINHISVREDTFYLETDDRYKFELRIRKEK